MDVQTGTLNTILTGGVEFITPDLTHQKVKNGAVYHLYKNYNSAIDSGMLTYKQAKNTHLIYINTEELGSLALDSKIYYKKIPVGKIVHYNLSDKHNEIIISAEINNKYQGLITDNSRFWRNSGLQVNAGLSGVDVNMASVHSLLNGGVSFENIKNTVAVPQKNSA